MANLAASYDALQKDGKVQNYPLGAAKKTYKGALVIVDTATGYAETGADAAAKGFIGVAYEDGDNTGGAAGAVSVRVHKTGSFVYNAAAAGQTWLSKTAYISGDDNSVALSSTNSIAVGVVTEFIGATKVRVRIDGAVK